MAAFRGTPIVGYAYLGWRANWNADLIHDSGGNVKLLAPSDPLITAISKGETQRNFVRKLTDATPGLNFSTMELMVDVTPSGGPTESSVNDFLHVPNSGMVGAGMGANDFCHSGHMLNGRPNGANILFVDCHAEWRRFRNLHPWYDCADRTVHFWF